MHKQIKVAGDSAHPPLALKPNGSVKAKSETEGTSGPQNVDFSLQNCFNENGDKHF